jgi:SAM-dependent methyltransferase
MKSIEYLKDFYDEKYKLIDFEKLSIHNNREIELYKKYWRLICKNVNLSLNHDNHLDLGCGIGTKTFAINHFGKKSTGIDLSEIVISKAQKLFPNPRINFRSGDAFTDEQRYDLITAFGFSLFNEKNSDIYSKRVIHFLNVNLATSNGIFVLGSFTDFSGNGIESWYLHTEKELDELKNKIELTTNFKVEFVFPHKFLSNYVGFGFYNFAAEVYKVLKRRKNYFIVISNG